MADGYRDIRRLQFPRAERRRMDFLPHGYRPVVVRRRPPPRLLAHLERRPPLARISRQPPHVHRLIRRMRYLQDERNDVPKLQLRSLIHVRLKRDVYGRLGFLRPCGPRCCAARNRRHAGRHQQPTRARAETQLAWPAASDAHGATPVHLPSHRDSLRIRFLKNAPTSGT